MRLNRREFLDWSLRYAALATALGALGRPAVAQGGRPQLLDVLPFIGEGRNFIGQLLGAGLDGRRAFDTSTLTSKRMITPVEDFFVRTRHPEHVDLDGPWKVAVDGLVEKPGTIDLGRVKAQSIPLGAHLVECAGSTSSSYYGLMSAAEWRGAPLGDLLTVFTPRPGATQIRVSGVDPKVGTNRGASWIFPLAEMSRIGLALADGMNGRPLTADHGKPLRLVVPGWYGCAWIKWVDRITFLGDDAEPTPHMLEYASRTHQPGLPRRAHDFEPAVIDHAALPVRLEMWRGGEGIFYRVVGIQWGGERPTDSLQIRLGDSAPWQPVTGEPPASTTTWSLWSVLWRPQASGRHTLVLRFADPALRTRRLDAGYYRRTVEIPEI